MAEFAGRYRVYETGLFAGVMALDVVLVENFCSCGVEFCSISRCSTF